MRSTTMWRTNRNYPAMDSAIRSDTINPGPFSGCQLTEPTVQDEPFCQASEFRKARRQRFEQVVIDDRFLGLRCSLCRYPTTRLKQGSELLPRADILDSRELLAQRCRKGVSPDFPILPELLGRRSIERHAVTNNPIADGGDGVLELERRLRITVRPQEAPKRLVDDNVVGAAGLNFRRPFSPVLELGADLR